MRRWLGWAICLVVNGTALSFANAQEDYASFMANLTADLPQEARDAIFRIVDCNHWTGEEPYDEARAEEIAAAITDLDCDGAYREIEQLQQKYAARPEVLNAIETALGTYF